MIAVPSRALVIAFDDKAPYDSPNFRWFGDRYDTFIYVDRLAVAPSQRRAGLGKALYEMLIACAQTSGYRRLCCEVNLSPPNPDSMAFHARLGFAQIGRAEARGKQVAYLMKEI